MSLPKPDTSKLYLKLANTDDWREEYEFIHTLPADEHAFLNPDKDATEEEFRNQVLPRLINNAKGIDLPKDWIPYSTWFLWADGKVVGLFRIRHHLTPALRECGGHIGYSIHPAHRGKGYATKGLSLAIAEAKKIIPEDYLIMSVHKDNIASRRVQEKNGARIVADKGTYYVTRIDL